MSGEAFHEGGVLYVPLPKVAVLYRVEVLWLEEVYELGLLGPGTRRGPTLAIAASGLERVAAVVRLHRVMGLDVQAIGLLLEHGSG